MKSRKWLIDQGLAKPTRGRLSGAAKQALAKAIAEGMQFDDMQGIEPTNVITAAVRKPAKRHAPVIVVTKPQRTQKLIWGLDKGKKLGMQDLSIAFSSCDGCGKPIQYCTHDEPKLPNWLTSKVYWEKPNG
jgi:CheY-like chemotaxis protein